MTSGQTNARNATPKDLAGVHYEEMTQSREAALAFLSTTDYTTRLGAIMICEQIWNAAREFPVVEACQTIAESDANDSIRQVAIGVLGRAFCSTRDPKISKFIARIVLNPQNSTELRINAYWILRQIQFGVADVDFDSFLLGMIHNVKSALSAFPDRFSEESVKSALLPHDGQFPENFWDSADLIDWDFVNRILVTVEDNA